MYSSELVSGESALEEQQPNPGGSKRLRLTEPSPAVLSPQPNAHLQPRYKYDTVASFYCVFDIVQCFLTLKITIGLKCIKPWTMKTCQI